MHVLAMEDGRQAVLFLDQGRRLQLIARGTSLWAPACLSPIAAQFGLSSTRRAELMRALDWLVLQGRMPDRMYRTEASAYRLLFILIALDGRRHQVPPRETARILFGDARVHHHWQDGGRAMRAQIRRAGERGEWLAAGGYRTLLR